MNTKDLKLKSIDYRKTILEIIFHGGAGHTGGSLSCIDILNVLYNKILAINPNNFNSYERNYYIQSKGHSVEALYTVLCDRNFFSKKDLFSLNQFKSHLLSFSGLHEPLEFYFCTTRGMLDSIRLSTSKRF